MDVAAKLVAKKVIVVVEKMPLPVPIRVVARRNKIAATFLEKEVRTG